MLDKDGPSKTVFAGTRAVRPDLAGHANVGLFLEPEDVEGASTVPQLHEERLNGMDDVEELEAIYR
jgi:hypothetical protein